MTGALTIGIAVALAAVAYLGFEVGRRWERHSWATLVDDLHGRIAWMARKRT